MLGGVSVVVRGAILRGLSDGDGGFALAAIASSDHFAVKATPSFAAHRLLFSIIGSVVMRVPSVLFTTVIVYLYSSLLLL
jgi:hypothetical protein